MPREVKFALSFLIGAGLLLIGWNVFTVLVVLHVFVSLVLISVILLQGGEAADLAGAFGGSGSQTAFGPRAAATILTKITTWCAVMFMFTTMTLTARVTSAGRGGSSVLEQFSSPPTPAAPATPTTPTQLATPEQSAPASAPAEPAQPSPAPAE